MNENLNNGNMESNNNNYEPYNNKKENNTLLIILIILVLCLIGLLSYKIIVVDKKDGNKVEEKDNTKEEEKTYEKIIYEIKEEYCTKCGTNLNYLYVNGKKTEDAKGDIKVNQFKDVLIVEWVGFTSYDVGVVYVTDDGNTHKFDYLTNNYSSELSNSRFIDFRILDNAIEIKVIRDDGFDNTTGWMCKKEEVTEYTKRYQYSDNGNFGSGKIINEVLVKDKFQNPEGCE